MLRKMAGAHNKENTPVRDLDHLFALIKQENSKLKNEVTAEVKEEIGKIADRITNLEEKYEQLVEQNASSADNAKVMQESLTNITEMHNKIKEQQDRIHRINNIIVMGIPENALTTLHNILDKVLPNNSYRAHTKVIRVGKPAEMKTRPIRVQLNSNNEVYTALRNGILLKDIEIHKNVYIRKDQTKQQQDERRRYMQEKKRTQTQDDMEEETEEQNSMESECNPGKRRIVSRPSQKGQSSSKYARMETHTNTN
ncbi:unnamed protein product [Orchesella dallaii]|uniref:Uncharacterized protein n=1 Tax=Orchesella dallaii TaxID=48710 RepID=A0ABP1PSH5_9HEXA